MGSREVFSIDDLKRLEIKARNFIATQTGCKKRIRNFYRNKPAEYYEDIITNRGGIMAPYLKDFNGDRRCPSNGQISGLYFMGRPGGKSPSKLPWFSPFGKKRFIIPAKRLFHQGCRLYFSDFWCHYKPHYVSLVVTKEGSDTDEFCAQYLLELDIYDNDYLQIERDTGEVQISTALWVEIFYTEHVNITDECDNHGARMKNTRVMGRGRSKPTGIPKNTQCNTCNLKTCNPIWQPVL